MNNNEEISVVPVVESDSYISVARQGNGSWVRYLIGTLLVFFIWLGVGTLATLAFVIAAGIWWGDFSMALQLVEQPPPEMIVPSFLVLMVSFVPFFVGVLGVVRFLHNRPVRTIVTGKSRIDWRRVGLGFGLWLALLVANLVIDLILRPNLYTFQFNLSQWLPYTLLALLFIPIQAGTEELFFRGYLMQASSLVSRNPLILILPSSLLFAGLHLENPEVATDFWVVASYYLLFALFAAWISLKDGTIELALGMHIANNLTAIIATFPDSALPAPAPIFKTVFEPALDVVLFIVMAAIFYFVAFRKQPQRVVPSNLVPPTDPAI